MKCTRIDNVKRNGLQSYLCAINDETLLSASEECSLADAIARGDKNALSRMIQANLRLVVKIAQDYVGKGLTLDDLVGEGNLGLIRAAELFESRYGTRFSTYASFWIKQSIRQALSNSNAMIRLPAHVLGLLSKWRKTERALGRELGRTPSFNEVASSLGFSESQKLLLAKAQRARQIKLESTVAPEAGRWSPVDSCDPYGPPELSVQHLDDKRLLRSRLECLEGRERVVLSLRYGLDNELPMTLKEIGDRMGVTREWVRKIELKAVRKLRGERTTQTNEVPGRLSTTISVRPAGKPPSRRTRSSRYGTQTTADPRSLTCEVGGPFPSPPAVAVIMSPSVWSYQWSSTNVAISSRQVDSLSAS
jgi:RNA polymerase primary sigma factor